MSAISGDPAPLAADKLSVVLDGIHRPARAGEAVVLWTSTTAAAGLIDEIILKVNPFLMGAGIPLFSAPIEQTALELTKSTVYDNGLVMLHYRVKQGGE